MKLPRIQINIDWTILIVPLLLAAASVATIYSITSFSGKPALAIDQGIYFLVAVVVYFVFMIFDYRQLKTYSWYAYAIGLVSLVLVVFLGQTIFGSKRWINFGFFQFQPSELMKLILLIFAADYFSRKSTLSYLKIAGFVLLAAVPIALILIEPDLGTALSVFIALGAIVFISKIPKKYLLILLALFIVATPIVWYKLKPYQKQRIVSFVDPAADPLGAGYNVSQSKIAVGSGGLYGKGFGQATQSQLHFLPVAQIDFIFSGWAEATGFIGSFGLVVAFGLLVWRIFAVSELSRDDFGSFFAAGAGALLLFQSVVNIGMNIGLMPVTGIPLPLMSYGGTSIIITAALLGIVQSIYLRRKALKFD